MSEVVKVIPKGNYQLEIELDDGRRAIIDVKTLLQKPIFQPLREKAFFRQVIIDKFGGLDWPNGADICVDWIEEEIAHPRFRAQTA